jgi:probable rRNA maturation factor
MNEIINQQRKIKIEVQDFQAFTEKAIGHLAVGKTATIAFVSDKKMSQLNRDFRGKNSTTDVLSFPFEADEFDTDDTFLGDIIISLEQAERQAIENNLTLELEVKQLILHGILHLLGYDHETDNGEMNDLELKWREKLGV